MHDPRPHTPTLAAPAHVTPRTILHFLDAEGVEKMQYPFDGVQHPRAPCKRQFAEVDAHMALVAEEKRLLAELRKNVELESRRVRGRGVLWLHGLSGTLQRYLRSYHGAYSDAELTDVLRRGPLFDEGMQLSFAQQAADEAGVRATELTDVLSELNEMVRVGRRNKPNRVPVRDDMPTNEPASAVRLVSHLPRLIVSNAPLTTPRALVEPYNIVTNYPQRLARFLHAAAKSMYIAVRAAGLAYVWAHTPELVPTVAEFGPPSDSDERKAYYRRLSRPRYLELYHDGRLVHMVTDGMQTQVLGTDKATAEDKAKEWGFPVNVLLLTNPVDADQAAKLFLATITWLEAAACLEYLAIPTTDPDDNYVDVAYKTLSALKNDGRV